MLNFESHSWISLWMHYFMFTNILFYLEITCIIVESKPIYNPIVAIREGYFDSFAQ